VLSVTELVVMFQLHYQQLELNEKLQYLFQIKEIKRNCGAKEMYYKSILLGDWNLKKRNCKGE
jgi:hypothetical protein